MERDTAEFDVVIVGGGIAGLSAALRLKQKAPHLSVAVLEKGAEIGAHILSGAVVDVTGIDKLLPSWRKDGNNPFTNPVTDDSIRFLTQKKAWHMPHGFMPKFMSNTGNYIVSLGGVCRWLAQQAEDLGVDIFPGFAAAEGVYNKDGALIGVVTGDMGLKSDGSKGENYQPSMELHGKYILIAEGARGSLAQDLIKRYGLDSACDVQKYGLGIKELWELAPENHQKGKVEHYFGWPLGKKATGGGFAYHMEGNKLALGLVVHLDYANPYLSPFGEFQRWKTHPVLRALLQNGKRLSYGARVINEGGYQSVPRLSFKGGALIGCAAGFVNLPRIKGSHNAVLSAIAAADSVIAAIKAGRAHDEITEIETDWRQSAIGRDLYPVRNFKPLLERFGSYGGAVCGGLDMWAGVLLRASPFGTLRHKSSDAKALKPAAKFKPIDYPKPDNIYSFDRASSLFLADLSVREGAPCHLQLKDKSLQTASEWSVYAGPSTRYCPAGVYEWQSENSAKHGAQGAKTDKAKSKKGGQARPETAHMRYCIFAENCIHCKACDIKDPNGNIKWTVPEGGSGPIYGDM